MLEPRWIDQPMPEFENRELTYEKYWGLQRRPFENVPDPHFYVASMKHETARQRLLYGIHARTGAIMLTGEIGCGKTLLSRALILDLSPSRYDVALVANPSLPADDFLSEVLYQFGIEASPSKAQSLHRLNDRLLQNWHRRVDSLLVVDEAQAIPEDRIFEDLRLLINFQLNDRCLLTLVLLGQPELKERISRIPQLDQRVAIRYHLQPCDADESRRYVQVRMKAAGGQREIFTKEATALIYERTGGVCRLINSLCDLCLLLGSLDKASEIDVRVVEHACCVS
jgi:general secretion pathway protein A